MEEKIDVLNELGEFTGKVATRDECHQENVAKHVECHSWRIY